MTDAGAKAPVTPPPLSKPLPKLPPEQKMVRPKFGDLPPRAWPWSGPRSRSEQQPHCPPALPLTTLTSPPPPVYTSFSARRFRRRSTGTTVDTRFATATPRLLEWDQPSPVAAIAPTTPKRSAVRSGEGCRMNSGHAKLLNWSEPPTPPNTKSPRAVAKKVTSLPRMEFRSPLAVDSSAEESSPSGPPTPARARSPFARGRLMPRPKSADPITLSPEAPPPGASLDPATPKQTTSFPQSPHARGHIAPRPKSADPITNGAELPTTTMTFEQRKSHPRYVYTLSETAETVWRPSRKNSAQKRAQLTGLEVGGDRPSHSFCVAGANHFTAFDSATAVKRAVRKTVTLYEVNHPHFTLFTNVVPPVKKPLRIQKKPSPPDAAGMLTARREARHLVLTRAQPPQEGKEDTRTHARKFTEFSHLTKSRDPIGQHGYTGLEEEAKNPLKRTIPAALETHVEPGTTCVWKENLSFQSRQRTRCTAPGESKPHLNTAVRTLNTEAAKAAGSPEPAQRPLNRAVPNAAGHASHADIITHRFSGGLCPEYKFLETSEQRSKFVVKSDNRTATTAEWANTTSMYNTNRTTLRNQSSILRDFLYEVKDKDVITV